MTRRDEIPAPAQHYRAGQAGDHRYRLHGSFLARKEPAIAADPQDPALHAGRVVRRMLLRRGTAIDAETAQLVADAIRTVLQAPPPAQPSRRRPRTPAAGREPLF